MDLQAEHDDTLPLIFSFYPTLLGLALRLLAYAMMLSTSTSRTVPNSAHQKGMHCKNSLFPPRVKSGLIVLCGVLSLKTHAPGMASNATRNKSLS